jgi:hypothetical protein
MKILITYLMFLIPGQIVSGLAGLFVDQFSKAAGITVFIVLYYAMFWIAWRGTLLIVDRQSAAGSGSGGSHAAAASVLLAPALLALDLAE